MRRVLLLGLAVLACGHPRLIVSTGDVQVSPGAIDFGAVVAGSTAARPLTLHNTSQGLRSVHVSAPAPFALDVTVEVPGGAMIDVAVTFAPIAEGAATGVATVVTDSGSAEVALSGQGAPAPVCAPPDDCHGCDGAPLPDGTACTGGSVCLIGGACVGGVCMGTPVSCDDGNACTLDVCVAASGCAHVDGSAQCPAPRDPCHAAVCDPKTGCGTVEVVDGTSCGPGDCTTAQVCLSGQCKTVAVPEGHSCAPASPCRGEGVCHQGNCQAPPATVLQEAWTYTPSGPALMLFEGVTDAAGDLYWLECEANPSSVYVCALVSYTPQGQQRFRTPAFVTGTLPVRQLLSGARFVAATSVGSFAAASTTSGAKLWDQALANLDSAVQVKQVAADDARVWATVTVWGDDMPQLFTMVDVFDSATGALLTQKVMPPVGVERGLVLDAAGNAYTMSADAGIPALVSLTAGGTVRFIAPNVEGPPLSLYNGELVMQQGSVRSALDGSSVAPSFSGWGQVPWQTPLMSAGARWMLGTANACAWCMACDCASDVPTDLSLRSYAAGAATLRFDHVLGYTAAFTDGVLLSDSSVLVAGRTGVQAAALTRIDAQGGEAFLCELPDAPAGSGMSYTYSGAVALTQGQWAVLRQIDCPPCFLTPPPELDVFAVPGLAEAQAGWTGRHGGPSRANRPH